jgi:hypothetical protein
MADLAAQALAGWQIPNHDSVFDHPAHPADTEPRAVFADGQVDIAFKRG